MFLSHYGVFLSLCNIIRQLILSVLLHCTVSLYAQLIDLHQ